jgi:hypothetical protein
MFGTTLIHGNHALADDRAAVIGDVSVGLYNGDVRVGTNIKKPGGTRLASISEISRQVARSAQTAAQAVAATHRRNGAHTGRDPTRDTGLVRVIPAFTGTIEAIIAPSPHRKAVAGPRSVGSGRRRVAPHAA